MGIPFLAETGKIVNLLPPVSIASGTSALYVDMRNYGHVDFVISTGANTSASSTGVTFQRATNTSGSSTQTLTLRSDYYHNAAALASASIANDTFVKTEASTSSTTFNLQSQANTIYIVPIDADDLGRLTSASVIADYNAVGITIDASGGATIAGVVAILTQARYQGAAPPSAV